MQKVPVRLSIRIPAIKCRREIPNEAMVVGYHCRINRRCCTRVLYFPRSGLCTNAGAGLGETSLVALILAAAALFIFMRFAGRLVGGILGVVLVLAVGWASAKRSKI